jgi:hypothetical protein
MNTNDVILRGGGAVATIHPLTATVGTVESVMYPETKLPHFNGGDIVALPEWFISTITRAEGESYWQAASRPNTFNPESESIITPYHIQHLSVLDMDTFERGK